MRPADKELTQAVRALRDPRARGSLGRSWARRQTPTPSPELPLTPGAAVSPCNAARVRVTTSGLREHADTSTDKCIADHRSRDIGESKSAAVTRPWAGALKPYSRPDARIFLGMLGT